MYFLGTVNYLNKYSTRLAELGDSLRELLKRNTLFVRSPKQTGVFDTMKKEISSALIL